MSDLSAFISRTAIIFKPWPACPRTIALSLHCLEADNLWNQLTINRVTTTTRSQWLNVQKIWCNHQTATNFSQSQGGWCSLCTLGNQVIKRSPVERKLLALFPCLHFSTPGIAAFSKCWCQLPSQQPQAPMNMLRESWRLTGEHSRTLRC